MAQQRSTCSEAGHSNAIEFSSDSIRRKKTIAKWANAVSDTEREEGRERRRTVCGLAVLGHRRRKERFGAVAGLLAGKAGRAAGLCW